MDVTNQCLAQLQRLTGTKPNGPLHLGGLNFSLRTRMLQEKCPLFMLCVVKKTPLLLKGTKGWIASWATAYDPIYLTPKTKWEIMLINIGQTCGLFFGWTKGTS